MTAGPRLLQTGGMAAKDLWTTDPRDALRVGPDFDLASFDRNGQPGWDGDKEDGEAYLPERGEEMSDLQERLFAEGREGGTRSVLLVLQGLDTAGKGGIVRHVMGMVDPQGVALASFGVPTEEERAHHYLWRIEKKLPPAGRIGVFDRSHYEDVLIVRVRQLVPEKEWSARYGLINDFEREVVAAGTTIIKVMLHISQDEQKARLAERLERPDKYYKFNPGDIDERRRWDDYQLAYEAAVTTCDTDHAPWFVVPADRKWYARLAVQQLLIEHLEALDLTWPPAGFDVEEQKARLAAS